MRRLKFLLRPSWIVMALLVAAFAFLCFSILAPWQLGKNTSTEHRNQLIADSINADPVPVESLISNNTINPDDEWRQVTLSGSYGLGSDALVRLRSIDGQPSYEVLTPFALDNGQVVLVNRGYVRPIEGTQPPPIDPPPSAEVTLNARVRVSEGVVAGRDPMLEGDLPQVYTINPAQVGSVVNNFALADLYVQLEPDQPGGLGVIPLPQLDAGPYLSYGLQWLAFGIMAPLGLGYFVYAELKERRREKDAANGVATPKKPKSSVDRDPRAAVARMNAEAAAKSPEDKLADRYGKRR
ncbi:MAG: SURF1 family protein [Rhodococcus sp.]|nr:SURF1 family protein [Rhodococcus sp. (in: high G+C Gram-positive bacteria)]